MTERSFKRKFLLAQRIAWAPTHTQTRLSCELFCRIAESVAPGFTAATDRQIAARIAGDQGHNNLAWADAVYAAYHRKKVFFLHELALRIGCRLVERHDPMPSMKGGR